MGVKVIARLAGISQPTIGGVMWGREGRNPPARIQRRTADAILGVKFDFDELLPSANVDITPYRRRLHALHCIGWTWTDLGRELGMPSGQVSAIAVSRHRTKIEAATARKIRDLYARLWCVLPAPRDATHAAKIALTKRRAATNGWAPPIAWDDIDAIDAAPDADVAKDAPGWVVSELAHLHELGESALQAAAQIGHQPESLAQLARRHHRPDLARWIGAKAA